MLTVRCREQRLASTSMGTACSRVDPSRFALRPTGVPPPPNAGEIHALDEAPANPAWR